MKKYLSRFTDFLRQDKQGSVLIEFAFVMPVLLIIFIGTVETTTYLGEVRRINTAAYTVADLIGRIEYIDQARADNIWKAASLIISPIDIGQVKAEASSVEYTGGKYTVKWTYKAGTGVNRKDQDLDPAELDGNLISAGDTLIMVDLTYTYQPLLTQTFMDFKGITLDSHIVMKPRRTSKIEDCPSGVNPAGTACNP